MLLDRFQQNLRPLRLHFLLMLRSTVKRDRVEILAVASDVKGVKFVEAI